MNNRFAVSTKFSHHGNTSGYDLLLDHIKYTKIFNQKEFEKDYLPDIKGLRRINRAIKNFKIQKFYGIMDQYFQNKSGIIHFIYPENTLQFYPYKIPESLKIFSTFHQPKEWFYNLHKSPYRQLMLNRLKRTDYAIALGKDIIPVINEVLKIDQVKFIPHGVNTKYFTPPAEKRYPKHVLIVGNWLRDMECASKVALYVAKMDSSVKFTVISISDNRRYFLSNSNVDFYSGISNSDLLKYLQTSSLLFLPLKGAIANNAILESASCGLPVYCTYFSAMDDYFNSDALYTFDLHLHNEPNKIAIGLLDILNNSRRLSESSILLRKQAVELDWSAIAKRVESYYTDF
ncbi:MAG: hypothetical protein M0Q53_07985 [Prolixibacteraceae bacterium]|jgi:glycosyltransferase involved in cell wall biosynthesis|nr:hypothetical protein [Prolixibacteraceae bacterium]